MNQHLNDLMDFLDGSPSPFHSVQSARKRLDAAGYTALEECTPWQLEPGKSYYTTRNQSSIIAFKVPAAGLTGWRMTAAHSDSATYRVKMDAENKLTGGLMKLAVEGYGGMIAGSWMDRPLTVAGRVLVNTGSGIESRLVHLDRDLLVIPSLAIHMDRTINASRELNPMRDMQPLFGGEGCPKLVSLLAAELGVEQDAILNADLTLCPRQKAVILGAEEEFIHSPRLDDLECAWGTLAGFLTSETPDSVAAVWCMFDNEEVGSGTRQGAMSTFLADVMARVEAVFGLTTEQHYAALAGSLLMSADNAHAVHPNHVDKADPVSPVYLNKGIVLKFNASQKYTTTALTGALFRQVCARKDVPVQVFTNRADMPGGSTLGNLLSSQVSIPMMDVGLPQLAMHACVETAGVQDTESLLNASASFFEAEIRCTSDGCYTVK